MGNPNEGQITRALIRNEDTGDEVTVHFNPKELSIDKAVPWQKHKTSESDAPTLEFTASDPKTMGVELLFDTYEQRTNVQDEIAKLDKLCKIINKDDKKRPPMVTWTWGDKMPTFKGVVESLGVKYTMFLNNGTPCRATVTLKLKEASKVMSKDTSADSGRGAAAAAGDDDVREPSGGAPAGGTGTPA